MKTQNSAAPGAQDEMQDELRSEYDVSVLKNGVRGKYVERYRQGTNLVILAPDVAAAFPTEEDVNKALRRLIANRDAAA
jgi:hypothetical protein